MEEQFNHVFVEIEDGDIVSYPINSILQTKAKKNTKAIKYYLLVAVFNRTDVIEITKESYLSVIDILRHKADTFSPKDKAY